MNYCTFWFSHIGPFDWNHCCRDHDTMDDVIDMLDYDREFFRELSDQDLRDCVNSVLPVMGDIMYLGLKLFGGIYQRITSCR